MLRRLRPQKGEQLACSIPSYHALVALKAEGASGGRGISPAETRNIRRLHLPVGVVSLRGARYGSVLGEKFGPRPFYDLSTDAGVTSLQGHEAVIGARVKVLGSDRRPELRGMLGTIERRFGHEDAPRPRRAARRRTAELFWAKGLEKTSDALGA